MKSASRISIVHCVERGNLIHSHWWHLQYFRHLIHDANTCETMLPLSQVQQWHNRSLLVLAWVSGEDLLDELFVRLIEFEGY